MVHDGAAFCFQFSPPPMGWAYNWKQTVLDLCSQTVCPITAGMHNDKSISPVPDATGKVACTIQWYDGATKSELLCIGMTLKLM